MEQLAPLFNSFFPSLSQLQEWLSEAGVGIIFFLIIVIVGYLISAGLGWIVKKILYRINLDKRLRKMDLHDSIGRSSISKIFGTLLKWYIFTALFFPQAIAFLELGRVSEFLVLFAKWLPNLVISVTIIVIGLLAIDFIMNKLLEIKNELIKGIANILKAILVIVVVFTAIEQLGIKTDLAQNIFLMVIAALLVTFSLAFGIGLGLSLKDELKPIIKKYKKKL